jgi:membrane fusion protein, multidrug efflux system
MKHRDFGTGMVGSAIGTRLTEWGKRRRECQKLQEREGRGVGAPVSVVLVRLAVLKLPVGAALAAVAFLLVGCDRPRAVPPTTRPKVTVSQPILREVMEWDEYTGRLAAVESVEVRPRVSGYLQSIHFNDGQIVQKGALLFVIDPRPYQAEVSRAEAELGLAKARLELAQSDVVRAKRLLQFRAISAEEADTRVATERQAQEQVQAASAAVEAVKLNVEFTRVTAPISGRISRKLVTEGNLINGGTAQSTLLTNIISLDPIHCYFEADERSYLKYVRLARAGKRPSSREVKNPLYLALADEKGFPHKGYMDFVDNRLDPNTGTMTGRAVIPNPDLTLSPGLFARVRLPGSAKYRALMLPDEAIGTDQSQKFVFVVDGESLVEYRAVQVGPTINGLRVVREGLKPEDWVIVNGVQRATSGAKVDPQRREISVPQRDFLTPGQASPAESNKNRR